MGADHGWPYSTSDILRRLDFVLVTNDISVKSCGGDWHSQICPLIDIFRRKCGGSGSRVQDQGIAQRGHCSHLRQTRRELCQQSSRRNGEKRHGKSWNS